MSGFSILGGVTQADLSKYLPLAGGTMTGPGPLLLSREPLDPMEASTKSYVDTHVTGALNFIGVIDAATGNCRFTAASGLPNGPLPPAASVANDYVICEVPGTIPSGEAAGITLAKGDWLASNGNAWYAIQVGQAGILASQVGLLPPVFTANEVQTALQNAEVQKVNKSGDTMTGTLTMDATLSMRANVRMSSPTAANVPGEAWPIDWFTANNYRMAQVVPVATGMVVGGQAECNLKFRTANGGWGFRDAMELQLASPPRTYCYGECSAANFINRSDLSLKNDVREATDTEAQIAFDGLNVIRYRWKEASDRRLRWGLNTDLLEITAPDAIEKISGKKHYDIGAVLAIVIAEVQRLRSLVCGQESEPVVKLPWTMRLRFRWVGLLQWIASKWPERPAPPVEEPEAEEVTHAHHR